MNQTGFRFNIFQKLLITLLVIALVPLVSLWYVGSKQAKADSMQQISKNLVTSADAIAARINGWDDANLRILTNATRLADITSMQALQQNPVLTAIGATFEWSYLVFTVAPDGNNIGRNDGKPVTFYGERNYFKSVMQGKPAAREVLIGKTTGKPALILSVPIPGIGTEPRGVLAMAMHLTDVSSAVTDRKIGRTGYAILLDAKNKVIAHGKTGATQNSLQDFSQHPALKIADITRRPMIYEADGKEMVAFVSKLPQGWTLLVEQERSEAFAAVERMEKDARNLILVTIALVFVVALLLGKRLSHPINELTVTAEKLSGGEFQVEIPETGRGDEIGALARAIERLGVSTQLAMNRLRKAA